MVFQTFAYLGEPTTKEQHLYLSSKRTSTGCQTSFKALSDKEYCGEPRFLLGIQKFSERNYERGCFQAPVTTLGPVPQPYIGLGHTETHGNTPKSIKDEGYPYWHCCGFLDTHDQKILHSKRALNVSYKSFQSDDDVYGTHIEHSQRLSIVMSQETWGWELRISCRVHTFSVKFRSRHCYHASHDDITRRSSNTEMYHLSVYPAIIFVYRSILSPLGYWISLPLKQ